MNDCPKCKSNEVKCRGSVMNCEECGELWPTPMTCKWVYNVDDCCYYTSCGVDWQFPVGTAKENGVKFCMCCGNEAVFVGEKKSC